MQYVQDLARNAQAAIGNEHLANVWLTRPSRLYGGETPAQAMANPAHKARILSQLNWFAGRRKPQPPIPAASLDEVLSDPMIQMALRSAGAGPEQLLALCQRARQRQEAA